MLVRASEYVANTSRYQGPNPLLIIGVLVAGYFGVSSAFYWLMQPTVVKNGLAGYHPPAATVISAGPAVLPPPTEPLVALAPPAPEIPEAAAASKKDVAKREARTTAPRRVVREQQNPMWGFASPQRQQQGGWGGGWGQGFSSQRYSSQGGGRWF
jgi:hypothetical protein